MEKIDWQLETSRSTIMKNDRPSRAFINCGESSQSIQSEDMPEIATNFENFDFGHQTASDLQDGMRTLRDDASEKMHATDVANNPKLLSEKVPENATNIDEVDATIAKQMMALSVEDREKVYMDVHGVKEGTRETEETIQAGLESMQFEIDKLPDKDAYELAWSMDQHYVENRSLRLAFLRSEYFDARKAAVKMVRHFQLKLDLFGKEKLALDIVQDDLDRDTIDAVYSGRGQYLDARDRAGRYILMVFFGDIFPPKATLQRAFYNTMVALRNPDVQTHGLVVVTFALFKFSAKPDTSKHWNFSKMNDGVPIRIEALHFCQNDMIPQELFAVSKAAVNPFLKIRTRTHHGTHNEVVSSLAQYGIPSGTIPITEGFKVTNVEAYDQRLRDLRSRERLKQPRRQKIGVPSRVDVLFGKGLPCQMHPGNIQLRSLVSERYKSYEKAAKGEKRKIAEDIVQTIQQNSGLFLRPDGDDSWVCVEDDVARQKENRIGSSKVSSSEDEGEFLAAPLLRSDSDDTNFSSADNNMEITTGNTNEEGPMYSSGPSEGGMKMILYKLLQIKTVADVLPGVFQVILTSGKMSGMVFVGSNLAFLGIWFPVYLFSKLVGEKGIYALTVATIFMVGRSIIRLLAFPGSTNRVSSEIEKEFSKYSVRMITASSISILDLGQAIVSAGSAQSGTQSYTVYEIPAMWKRAKSYRDRVLAVYLEVLQYIYDESSDQSSSPIMSDTTKYGNNKLSGDIGDLSGLTLEARADGKRLLEHLNRVLSDMDRLEEQAGSMLQQSSGTTQMPSSSVRMIANSLIVVTTDLRDFVESLSPSGGGDASSPGEGDEANLSVDAVRRRFEEQNTSLMDSITSGASSILSMLDPPLHTSIFGFDVQRGCMLARYKGAKQMWVKRPSGGMIDVIHIPATSHSHSSQKNPKAVMYCNPNAGLIEVATGMSLAGGNVMQEEEGVVNDNCWTDFYTNAGYDIYLFNYAGFGRSFGSGYCGVGRRGGEEPYIEGKYGRFKRIIDGTFFGFQPTPATLRADGLALGTHVVSECGVESLVIHGESIGGVAASGTARHLSQTPTSKDKLSLLICDRTFCNLEAVAQRLVGGWSAYAVRCLAPFWSTDVAGDFLAAHCRKVVATDSADAIIADPSSLKAGIAWWKELSRGKETTKGIGWMMDAPVQYRMADWENSAVNQSRYVQPAFTRATAPVWPADKHISLEEAFHFAACTKRLGKLASIEKKREAMVNLMEQGHAGECQAPIFLIWKGLACCDGLCGAALGMTVKGGFDCTVSWLCSLLTFGGQTVVEGMEHRQQLPFGQSDPSKLGEALPSDFDCRPPGFEKQESDSVVHPKPIPEVLDGIKNIMEGNPEDAMLERVKEELSFIVGTLEYIVARLSSPSVVEQSWKNRHLGVDESMVGSFMNLHCGHNNPFSAGERSRLRDILMQAGGQK